MRVYKSLLFLVMLFAYSNFAYSIPFREISGGMEKIASNGSYTFATNSEGFLFKWDGSKWVNIGALPDGRAKDIAVDSQGNVLLLGSTSMRGGYKIFLSHQEPAQPSQAPAQPAPEQKYKSINLEKAGFKLVNGVFTKVVVGGNAVWAINKDGSVYKLNKPQSSLSNLAWQEIPGVKLKDISVGEDETVFGVGLDSKVMRLFNNKWETVAGVANKISVADKNSVWVVGTDTAVWRMNNPTVADPNAATWQKVGVPSGVICVSAGLSNNAWFINNANQNWRWNSQSTNYANHGDWGVMLDANFHQVSVADASNIYGVDGAGSLYKVNSINGAQVNKSLLAQGAVNQVSVNKNGQVWLLGREAVNGNFKLYTNASQLASPSSAASSSTQPTKQTPPAPSAQKADPEQKINNQIQLANNQADLRNLLNKINGLQNPLSDETRKNLYNKAYSLSNSIDLKLISDLNGSPKVNFKDKQKITLYLTKYAGFNQTAFLWGLIKNSNAELASLFFDKLKAIVAGMSSLNQTQVNTLDSVRKSNLLNRTQKNDIKSWIDSKGTAVRRFGGRRRR